MKRLLSVVLTLVMICSLCVTGIEASAADTATVNGKTYEVGSTVTYTLDLQTPEKIEDYQGNIYFSTNGLELKTFKATDEASIFVNVDVEDDGVTFKQFTNEDPSTLYDGNGNTIVSFNATSARVPFDYTTKKTLIEMTFRITAAGTWTIDNKWYIITGASSSADGTQYYYKGEEKIAGAVVTDQTVEGDQSQTSSTATTASVPTPQKATVNGVEYNVGDEVLYTYSAKFDSKIQNYQGELKYTHTGLNLLEYKPNPTYETGLFTNLLTADDGYTVTGFTNEGDAALYDGDKLVVSYNASSPNRPFDLTAGGVLFTAKFKVTGVGAWTIDNILIEAYDTNDDPYIVKGNKVKDCETEGVVTLDTPISSSTTGTATSPSSSSQILPAKTTFNGIEVKVGDTVVYEEWLIADKEIQAFNADCEYGNKVTGDTTGIELVSFVPYQASNVMYNAAIPGYFGINGTTPMAPYYDFRAPGMTKLYSLTFKITADGTYYADNVFSVLTASDDEYYVDAKGNVLRPFTSEQKIFINPSDTSSTVTSTSATSSSETSTSSSQISSSSPTQTSSSNPVSGTKFRSVGLIGTVNGAGGWDNESYELAYANGVWSVTIDFTGGANNFKARVDDDWAISFGNGSDGMDSNITETLTGKYMISVADGAENGTALTLTKMGGGDTSSSETTPPVIVGPTSETVPKTSEGQVITIKKMALNTAVLTVTEGEKVDLTASIWPGYTTQKTVTWSVTSSRVGVVSQSKSTVTGLYDSEGKLYCTETATFTAKDDGTTIVKAVSDTGLVVKCVITVVPAAKTIAVSPSSVSLKVGQSKTAKATVGPSSISSSYKSVTWASSNKKVATVTSAGVIKAVGKGTCKVTATSKDNTSLKKSITVKVTQPVTSISLSKKTVKLAKKGKTATITVTANPTNANNRKIGVTVKKKKIAKVNKTTINGKAKIKITAKKKGTTYIIFKAKDGSNKTAKCKVTVKK